MPSILYLFTTYNPQFLSFRIKWRDIQIARFQRNCKILKMETTGLSSIDLSTQYSYRHINALIKSRNFKVPAKPTPIDFDYLLSVSLTLMPEEWFEYHQQSMVFNNFYSGFREQYLKHTESRYFPRMKDLWQTGTEDLVK